MQDQIDYGYLMHRAMRGLINEVLAGVAEHGLPGEHHFFITFDTRHPGVKMAAWLRKRYPEDMTIVIQNWFEELAVDPEGFSVTLNFGDIPERLHIPFDALRTFVDPSVEFGLRFESEDGDKAAESSPEKAAKSAPTPQNADVVSLDTFRK